nr:condensation domain-containing protein [Paenibacillus thiaminolyticus]
MAPLRLQYKDYAVWQQDHYAESRADEQLEAHWVDQFAGELPVLSLPADRFRPAVRSFEGGRVTVELDGGGTRVGPRERRYGIYGSAGRSQHAAGAA